MISLAGARAPDGMRLYAIGDIHGCREALATLRAAVEAHLAARPPADWRIVLLGDYVDRGADSAGVIDLLATWTAAEPRVVCLRGNHDDLFERALAGDRHAVDIWLANGGAETLESYGVSVAQFLERLGTPRTVPDATPAVPAAHRTFLSRLPNSARFGDYYFVHAGIDPSRGLDRQEPEAQLWIREPFLTSTRIFEAVIVHGHTPVSRVAVRPNRIGIDTGAVFGGALSCLVLEGASKGLLSGARVVPLPKPG